MNGDFHRRCHEHSPSQYVVFNWERRIYFRPSQFLLYALEYLSHVPVIRESHILQSSSLFARVWSFCPSFLWARLTFSCRLTWEFSTSKFELEVPHFPEAKATLFLLSSFTGLTKDPDLCGETSSLHWPCITSLAGLAFATWDPSLGVVSCPRFDMAPITRRSLAWERKRLKWLPEYVEKLMKLKQTQKVIPLISGETSINDSKLVLGVNIFDLDLCVLNWFCQTTNQEQLCGFWTRVSLLDFVL